MCSLLPLSVISLCFLCSMSRQCHAVFSQGPYWKYVIVSQQDTENSVLYHQISLVHLFQAALSINMFFFGTTYETAE